MKSLPPAARLGVHAALASPRAERRPSISLLILGRTRTGRRIAWLGIIAIALFFSVQISGCSLIGLVVGFAVDQGVPKGVRVIPPHQALEVSPGARVAFHLKDGTTVSGRYLGVARIPEEAYARRYRSWRDSLPPGESFPALGDSITLTLRSGEALAATFGGFGYRQVKLGSAAGVESGVVRFENLVAISGPAGRSIPAEHLVTLDISGDLPSATALRVLDVFDTSLTALDRVARVSIPTVRHGARNGFLIGFAIDAIVMAIAVATYEPPTSSCEPQGNPGVFATGVRPLEAPFDIWAGRVVLRTDSTTGRTTREDPPALVAGSPAGN